MQPESRLMQKAAQGCIQGLKSIRQSANLSLTEKVNVQAAQLTYCTQIFPRLFLASCTLGNNESSFKQKLTYPTWGAQQHW